MSEKPLLISDPSEVQAHAREWKKQGLSIGLVPTMGYLHDGHRSLIHKACEQNDRVIVSIFVNPIQFAPGEDLDRYPRDIEADSALCAEEGVDIIYHPEASDMYGENFSTHVEVDGITKLLEGKTRPIHFRGVTTVVNKLMNISKADRAYFGQKDAQQLAVVRKMVKDLNMDIEIVGCPIIREEDGLAKSSRNKYLSAEERKAATVLSRALRKGRNLLESGERDADKIRKTITDEINTEPLSDIDYVAVVDAETLEDVNGKIEKSVLVPIAVKIGKTRLIDNFIFE